jgi:FixJ family two-component response regulator
VPDRKAVLVVDDDQSTLRGIKRLLKACGFEAVLFESVDAVENADFDRAFCLVLDINLGNESGIELRRRLAASGVSLPVIYITGKDSDRVRKAAMDSGCIAYLTKPFPAKALIDPLRKELSAHS